MTEFKQIATNPELIDWQHRETKTDHQHKQVVIELAANWEYIYIPGLEYSQGQHPDHVDYNRIPQSLHWDNGMKLTWGWMKFQAGYQQHIAVKANQRYTAVVKFHADIRETGKPEDVQWQLFVDGLKSKHSEWSSYPSASEFGMATEHQFVFQTDADGWIDLTFWAKTGWQNNTGEIAIRSIEVFEVPNDYGSAEYVVPFPNDQQHPNPDPDPPIPPEPTPQAPKWLLPVMFAIGVAVVIAVLYSLIMSTQTSAQGVSVMEDLLNQLFAIPAIAPIAFSGAIILYLVEVGKRLKAKYLPDVAEWLTPQFMVGFWVVIFMGSFGIAEQYAYDNVFKQIAELVTQLIGVLGPYVLGMLGTQVVAAVAHTRVRNLGVAGFDQ